jgi:hypothetical protein
MILRLVKRYPSWDMYNAVNAVLDVDHKHPLGLIMHGAAESESDGMFQLAQVWDSDEYAWRFDEEHLKPALEAVGAPLEAEITVMELRHLVTP